MIDFAMLAEGKDDDLFRTTQLVEGRKYPWRRANRVDQTDADQHGAFHARGEVDHVVVVRWCGLWPRPCPGFASTTSANRGAGWPADR